VEKVFISTGLNNEGMTDGGEEKDNTLTYL